MDITLLKQLDDALFPKKEVVIVFLIKIWLLVENSTVYNVGAPPSVRNSGVEGESCLPNTWSHKMQPRS
jgi:hypothetical protein